MSLSRFPNRVNAFLNTRMIRKLFLFALLLSPGVHLCAQTATLSGFISDAETTQRIADATVALTPRTGKLTTSDTEGAFKIEGIQAGSYTLVVTKPGYLPAELPLELANGETQNLKVPLRRDPSGNVAGDIPTVTLEEAESETDGAAEIANLLHASRDVFQNISGFGWSTFRFRERGYDSGLFQLYLNGVPFNDPESGSAFFGEFGGLNDVLRNRNSTIGLDAAEFAFGDLGGTTFLDTRASTQRKQIRVSYAASNRIYRHRAMITYNTGLIPGGWAVSISGSRRWAEEGYQQGTFFDGYSYFLSVDKKFGQKHLLNLTFLGAPNRRGRAADSFQEMYDISGNNYYNPLWGFWNGKKRNAQVASNNQPIAMLRYDWSPSSKTGITLTGYSQFGNTGFTRLNWLDGANPAPDFNRRLPSTLEDPALAADWAAQLGEDEALRQINWASLYEANTRNPFTVENADGGSGSVSGNKSIYILEDNRTENLEAGFNAFFRHNLNTRTTLNGGLQYQYYKSRNFKEVDDLLGGDYWVDWDFFGVFDGATNPQGRNSDLLNPNNVVREGDVFGYDYDDNIRKGSAWAQAQFTLPRFQIFVGGEAGRSNVWRTGNMQNGRFPDNSLGDSEKQTFTNYAVKGGITWKINGRNYLYANAQTGQRAPRYRDVFISPRTRNVVVPGIKESTVLSTEAGYQLRSPNLKARLTGYFTEFRNETEIIFGNAMSVSRLLTGIDFGAINIDDDDSFLNFPVFFGSVATTGINRRHMGIEAGIEAKPIVGWVVSGAASLGNYVYTSRPNLVLSLDYSDSPIIEAGPVYQKNFYVPRTPQTAASISLKHENRRFWFASLTLNYAGNFWYDFDRIRRTQLYIGELTPESPIWNTMLDQQRAPSAFTLDFFGGKSWRIRYKYFLYLNVGVNNILNNQNIVISGRDSYRNAFRNDVNDARFYTNELLYAFGTNYFISLTFRM